ncbi:MAG: AsmA family protein, partial [Salinisphaeraceae bacterium]|nr:AsmA family protein [Salinisphaeraceae bacterium]
GLAVAGIVALAVLLPLYFDPNDFKDEIAAAAKDKTGRDLTITGDIGLTVFPWLGVELGETSMSNAAGFGDKPFAEFENAVVRLQLMPLLRGEIEVGRVILDKLRLRLAKNAQGVNNWQDIQAEMAKDDEVEAADEAKKEAEEKGFEVKSLQIAGVEVNDAAIYWNDAQAGSNYKFEDVNLETGTLVPGEPAPVQLDMVVGLAEPNVTGQIHAEAQVNVDVEKKQYAAKGLLLELVAIGEGVPNGKQSIKLTADASADLAAQTLSLPNLVVNAAGGELTGSLSGKQIVDKPILSGSLKGNNLSPRDILKTLGKDVPETADSSVLSNASLDVKFSGPIDNLQIKPLVAKLDDTNINGSARLSRNSPLVIGFDLNVDSLDLDRYLPPSEKPKQQSGDVAVAKAPPPEGKVESKNKGTSDINDTEIPVDVLKSLNMDGKLKIKQFIVKGMKMNNVALDVESRNGRLEIKPLDAALYQGNADIRAVVNANGTPAYALKTSLKSVQSGLLLKDLLGHDKLSGLANVDLDLASKGRTVGAMRKTLNGDVDVEFLEGKIKGFNLGQMLRAAKARLSGQPAP